MPDFLLELFSEEIPARMQVQAAKDLERLVVGALSDRELLFEGVKSFSGPRRLTLAIEGLPAKQPDVSEELKGPKTDAPQQAIDGFLKKTGLTIGQLEPRDAGKGQVYFAVIKREGRDTATVLAEILPESFAKLPWPKSMRFPGSAVRWVRPLHGIVCLFDGEVVTFDFAGVTSGNTTTGHRFLSKGALTVRHFEDYEKTLRDHHVILDAEERKEIITHQLKQQGFALGLEPIPDEGLLNEVAGLAEWPTVLIGTIEDQFMDLPPEILQTSMRTHQKYFSLRDTASAKMANRFALVSNMVAQDGGKEIVAGNERVLRARLSDAKFFWDQDRKRTLESRVKDLKGIVFHAKLGTQYERILRIEALAGEIAEKIGADVEKARRAARLCKADLTTGVVGEFPELQGLMGAYYALHDDEDADVVEAVRDHYKPQGPSDEVPTPKVGIAVALADKLEQLTSFFAIDERPTGSGDPFALRRAGLGFVRTILENQVRLVWINFDSPAINKTWDEVLFFLVKRISIALRTGGLNQNLIDAAFAVSLDEGDLVRLVARVEALQSFLKTDSGANLLAGYKRAANILKAEEKKDKTCFDGAPDAALLTLPEERALATALAAAESRIAADVAAENFVAAMEAMAGLRVPVDAFFDTVKVNDDAPAVRLNRLNLLARLRATLHLVADFSKIEG